MSRSHTRFGDQTPFCEPAWYQGGFTPYYTDAHVAFRARVRAFVDTELAPHVEDWVKSPAGYPRELHERAFAAGLQGVTYPREYGGTMPDDYDAFYELILFDELSRLGSYVGVLGHMGINGIALPPIIKYGSEALKRRVVRDVVQGRKNISLAISEPGAGSDVAGIATTAVRDGDEYVINGMKKWITGGHMADYYTVAVKTGEGAGGISVVLVERERPGITVRKMATQFDTCHGTTFIAFDHVRVPISNIIGEENRGFEVLMLNFNHERFGIAVTVARGARLCFAEAFKHALERKTFGKPLVKHQIIRFKLAEMARQVEALQDFVERVAYQFSCGVPDSRLGGMCALLKVQASKTFEYCAREASQIFGGSSIVKEGKGKLVERLYREVRAQAIPGGSEEILLDFAIRQAASKATARVEGRSKL